MLFGSTLWQFINLRLTLFVWVVIFLIFVSISKAEILPVKTYTVADGLLRDDVQKVMQDSRGFLWFCTFEGVSRFDGYGFTNFRTEDGLPERHVRDILETKSGTIWMATDAGLAKLNPRGIRGEQENPLFTTYLPENPKAKLIQVLFEDSDETLWVGTADGLYRLNKNNELESISIDNSSADRIEITTIIQDRRGALWIGTFGKGLFRLTSPEQIEKFTVADGLPDNNIAAIREDRDGRIWVGFRPDKQGGLVRLVAEPKHGKSIVERAFTVKDGLPSNWVTDLYQFDSGKFWIATLAGLCLWQGEDQNQVCKTYTGENRLCDDDIWSITEDKDGNLWTGTGCGAKKLSRYGFTTYTASDGLYNSDIKSIFENANGDFFVHVNTELDKNTKNFNFAVSRYDGTRFVSKKLNLDTPVNTKQTIKQDSHGIWWIPTSKGLFRSPENTDFSDLSRITPVEVKIGAASKTISRVFEDSETNIWITTNISAFELWRWERVTNTWHDYTKDVGFSSKRFGLVFVEDRSGNLWIATGSDDDDSAVIRYRDGNFKVFTQSEGAPPNWTKDMFLDKAGRIWLANNTWGLLRLDDVNGDSLNFVRYTTAEGLSSNGVYSVTEDEFGRIYAGTGSGLDRLNPVTGQIENFTTADGLPNGWVNEAFRDRKNVLWFGVTYGLARFLPEPERERKSPNILITGLRVEGEAQSVSILGENSIPELDLNSEQRQISLDFIGLGASLGEKLKYEYRFSESDWTQTNERTINFANLASGAYQFEVRAQTADRIYSQPAIVSFRIAAPIWQRWWFIALAVVLVGLMIYYIYRNRLKRLIEMERMRTRIATDLHDDIGANLTRIALLSEVANQQAVNGNGILLTSIADIARESVASMNDIVWAIAPEHDSLLDLTRRMRQHAEEVFSLRDIDLSFDAPAFETDLKLSVGVRRDVLLIFKEAVNNAARHSDCSQVTIKFSVENSKLLLQIKDNGTGFTDDSENDGQGLRSMSRRAKALGGDLTIESNNGTLVKFELVLAKNSRI